MSLVYLRNRVARASTAVTTFGYFLIVLSKSFKCNRAQRSPVSFITLFRRNWTNMNQWAHVRQPVEADSSFRVNQGNFDLKNNIWILASNNKITAPYSLVIEYT